MKAALLEALHQPVFVHDCPQPQPQQGQCLVAINSAALNHRDVFIQKGLYAGIKVPVVLGSDGSGIVAAVGADTDSSWIGKEVIINPGLNWGPHQTHQAKDYIILGTPTDGTFAEYVTVDQSLVHDKPSHLNWHEAAALPLAGVTAYRAIMIQGALKKGDKVLITGIGGGVAQMALQFAVANGNEVWVTSGSEEKIDGAKKLGAKGGINYHTDKWHKELMKQTGEFDLIIDSACGDGFGQVIDCCKPGGKIVIFGGTSGSINNIIPAKIFWRQISIIGSTMGSNHDFGNMLAFVNKHQIKPVVNSVFKLEETQKALDFLASGKHFGKVVLEIL